MGAAFSPEKRISPNGSKTKVVEGIMIEINCPNCGAALLLDKLANEETEIVAPVVMGEWNEIEHGGLLIKYTLFRCTQCGNTFKVYEDTLNAGRGDKNFCPNCGADMRREQ